MNKNGDEDLKKMIFNNISFFGSIPFYEEWIKQNLEEYSKIILNPYNFYTSRPRNAIYTSYYNNMYVLC